MLVGGYPAALLAFTARRARRLAAIDPLRDPARELESAGARIFVDQQAMRETVGRERGIHFAARRFEPRWQGVHVMRRHGREPQASSSAASAASQT